MEPSRLPAVCKWRHRDVRGERVMDVRQVEDFPRDAARNVIKTGSDLARPLRAVTFVYVRAFSNSSLVKKLPPLLAISTKPDRRPQDRGSYWARDELVAD